MRGVMRVRFVLVGCRNCHGLYLCESLDGKSDPVVRGRLFKIEQGLDRCWNLMPNDIRRAFRMIETGRNADKNGLAFVLSIFGGMRVGEIAALRVGD
jgi:integrase